MLMFDFRYVISWEESIPGSKSALVGYPLFRVLTMRSSSRPRRRRRIQVTPIGATQRFGGSHVSAIHPAAFRRVVLANCAKIFRPRRVRWNMCLYKSARRRGRAQCSDASRGRPSSSELWKTREELETRSRTQKACKVSCATWPA